MIRTVTSLDTDDKRWLDQRAARDGISMSEVIRRAGRRIRSEESQAIALERGLRETHGACSGTDGYEAQKGFRDEWNRRSA